MIHMSIRVWLLYTALSLPRVWSPRKYLDCFCFLATCCSGLVLGFVRSCPCSLDRTWIASKSNEDFFVMLSMPTKNCKVRWQFLNLWNFWLKHLRLVSWALPTRGGLQTNASILEEMKNACKNTITCSMISLWCSKTNQLNKLPSNHVLHQINISYNSIESDINMCFYFDELSFPNTPLYSFNWWHDWNIPYTSLAKSYIDY